MPLLGTAGEGIQKKSVTLPGVCAGGVDAGQTAAVVGTSRTPDLLPNTIPLRCRVSLLAAGAAKRSVVHVLTHYGVGPGCNELATAQ